MATSQQQLNFAIRAVNEASATLKKVQQDIDGLGTTSAGATKHTTGLGNSLGSMSKIAGGFVMGAGLLALPGLLKGTVDAASDANETLSKSNTIFGENAAAIEKWASGAAKSIGQSKTQALDAAGTFGNLFVQLGVGTGEAAKMSTQMVELASDFASFHNAAPTDVLIAMTAAFRGEYDAVQRYVPTINAAAVEQKALKLGLAATTKELTAQDKALAVQTLLVEGAGDALGDFDRTSQGAANQQRILAAQLADTQQKFGEALLPVLVKLLPIVVKVVDAFSKVPAPLLAVGAGLVAVGAAIALVAGPIGAIIGLFGGLAGGVGALAGGAGFLALLGPIGLVVAAIAAAIAIGVLIYKNWDTIKEKASELGGWLAERFNYIKDRAGDLKEWVVTAFTRVSDFLSGAFHALMNSALVKIALMFTPVGPLMILFQFKDKIADALGGIGDVFERAFGPVFGVLSKVGGWLGGLIDKIADFTGRGVSAAASAVAGLGMAGGPSFTGIPTWENRDALASVADSEGFATGGVIPGPRGMPVIIKAHSGEHITPVGGSAVAPNITINFPSGVILDSEATVQRWILSALHIARQRGDLGFA